MGIACWGDKDEKVSVSEWEGPGGGGREVRGKLSPTTLKVSLIAGPITSNNTLWLLGAFLPEPGTFPDILRREEDEVCYYHHHVTVRPGDPERWRGLLKSQGT